ncbi:MAG: GIY-YIG nuclease family protein [Saprospiraceae bacterium]|nr:GIY-YIG nuclease family protein [Saprospiraceae bacterium]
MPAFTYILYSPSKDRYYIGATNSLADRLNRHNFGYSKSTRSGKPWLLVYTQQFDNFQEATTFESDLKKQKKRSAYIPLIQNYRSNPFPLP